MSKVFVIFHGIYQGCRKQLKSVEAIHTKFNKFSKKGLHKLLEYGVYYNGIGSEMI